MQKKTQEMYRREFVVFRVNEKTSVVLSLSKYY